MYQAVSTRRFAEVRLLNNLESQDAQDYAAWLRKASSARIIIHQTHLTSPTNFGEIYQAALNTISETLQIIAATNRNLIDEMAAGNFREDLFYRLAVGVIKLPPLRDRAGNEASKSDNDSGNPLLKRCSRRSAVFSPAPTVNESP